MTLPGGEETDDDAPEPPRGRFTLADVTSGLPDDSREADERAAARHLADLRGRVKAARAAIARFPGSAEAIQRDPSRTARLCARFGISPEQLRAGVPAASVASSDDPNWAPNPPVDWIAEMRARDRAVFANWIPASSRPESPAGRQGTGEVAEGRS